MDNKLFSRNFTLLILGQASSLFGNCILDFAMSMYVLEVTGSAAVFAGFLAAAMLPTILLSPLGGVLADRANRRKIMMLLDLASGLIVLLTAFLIDRGNNLVIIGAALIIMSILGAFETPTVQACIPQMQSGGNIVRANAVANQISALSMLIGPFAGSLVYTAFGLKTVMYAGGVCFLVTAGLEYFIRLDDVSSKEKEGIWNIIKGDLTVSAQFICKKTPAILKTLLLTAVIGFFIQGTEVVGLPYIVRTVLGLGAGYYGAAESVLSFAGILGSIIAGLAAAKFSIGRLYLPLAGIGLFLVPISIVFSIQSGVYVRYAVLMLSFSVIQILASIFSIFALSVIQQLTPENMTGKVMAYAASFSLCIQPLGQMIYGVLFDKFTDSVYWVILPTGVILSLIGIGTKKFFGNVEIQLAEEIDQNAEKVL